MATFNTAPNRGEDQWFSTEGNHVGTWGDEGFVPSKYDFSGFKPSDRDVSTTSFGQIGIDDATALKKPNGETVFWNPRTDTVLGYIPPDSAYTNKAQNTWNSYATPNVGDTYNFQGTTIPVDTYPKQYNPNTNSLVTDAGGNPAVARMASKDSGSLGGFSDFMADYGYLAPIALAGGAAAAEFLPALGAEAAGGAEAIAPDVFAGYSATGSAAGTAGETVGAYGAGTAAGGAGGVTDIGLGTNAALQGPTYGELGVTGVPETTPSAFTDANLGYTGAAQDLGLEGSSTGLTDLSGTQGSATLDAMGLNSGTSTADALKTANDVRKGVSTAQNLAKALSPSSQLTNAAQNLATGQTGVGSAIPALLRGNQNPFLQTAQQPIRSTPDLASLAQLLKQG